MVVLNIEPKIAEKASPRCDRFLATAYDGRRARRCELPGVGMAGVA